MLILESKETVLYFSGKIFDQQDTSTCIGVLIIIRGMFCVH